jgi:rfaE bifunctional protein nucleotidyltransferase chain/domain
MAAADEFLGRILEREAAIAWREDLRARGLRVVFTNGCFDLLHAGHVAYLAWARAQGDALIVGLNGDASVRDLKGPERPIVPFDGRAEVLAALRSVDAVVRFDEKTPIELLAALRPDVHVKSAQYRIEELPERYVVEANGGRIALAPHVHGKSTTDIVANIIGRTSAR